MGYFAEELTQRAPSFASNLDDTAQFRDPMPCFSTTQTSLTPRNLYQRPDEYRLLEIQLLTSSKLFNTVKASYDSEHFMFPFAEIEEQFPKDKHIMMEHFYRRMRKSVSIFS
ncbi:cryptochrome/photolyase family protein [Vibrio chagasii]|nr:cryptochrome/photolyase family protein [Vibrio chagasii]